LLSYAEHQAYDLTGKTKANVDSFSAGYIAKSGTGNKAVSALWANVEWTEAVGGGGTARNLTLMGVGP
jgi:hypothetical protein